MKKCSDLATFSHSLNMKEKPIIISHWSCIVALDLGVRIFQTMYDAGGFGIEWGEGDMKMTFVVCCQADNIYIH